MGVYRGMEQTQYNQHWACPTNRDVVNEQRTFYAFSLLLCVCVCVHVTSQFKSRGCNLYHSQDITNVRIQRQGREQFGFYHTGLHMKRGREKDQASVF